MRRWSLRRHKHRGPKPGVDRLEPDQPGSVQPGPGSLNGYRSPGDGAPATPASGIPVSTASGYAPPTAGGTQPGTYAPQPTTAYLGQQVSGYNPASAPTLPQGGWARRPQPAPFGSSFARLTAGRRSAQPPQPTQPGQLAQPTQPFQPGQPAQAGWSDQAGQAAQAAPTGEQAAVQASQSHAAWPETMDQFGLQLLTLAEEMRISLDELEADEDDPERLQRLYKVDHAVTRMRRASRDLRTLAGRAEEDMGGVDTSVLDVIRMALSSIERYTQVTIGRVTDFSVIGYAADDVACLLAALLDNATRYSPGTVSVSAHLSDDGSVLFRVEDTGIGIPASAIEPLNAVLAGEVPQLDERSGRHTGFPVVHRIARKHSIGVRLASRPSPSTGTIVMVTVPPQLLCELPVEPVRRPEPPRPRPEHRPVSVLPAARRESLQAPGGTTPPTAPAPRVPSPVPDPAEQTAEHPAVPADDRLDDRPEDRLEDRLGDRPEDRPGDRPDDRREGPSEDHVADRSDGTAPDADADESTDEAETTTALPRREPVSLRGTNGPLRRDATQPSPEEQAAARRSFADDLDAFSLGSRESSGDSAGKGKSS